MKPRDYVACARTWTTVCIRIRCFVLRPFCLQHTMPAESHSLQDTSSALLDGSPRCDLHKPSSFPPLQLCCCTCSAQHALLPRFLSSQTITSCNAQSNPIAKAKALQFFNPKLISLLSGPLGPFRLCFMFDINFLARLYSPMSKFCLLHCRPLNTYFQAENIVSSQLVDRCVEQSSVGQVEEGRERGPGTQNSKVPMSRFSSDSIPTGQTFPIPAAATISIYPLPPKTVQKRDSFCHCWDRSLRKALPILQF